MKLYFPSLSFKASFKLELDNWLLLTTIFNEIMRNYFIMHGRQHNEIYNWNLTMFLRKNVWRWKSLCNLSSFCNGMLRVLWASDYLVLVNCSIFYVIKRKLEELKLSLKDILIWHSMKLFFYLLDVNRGTLEYFC